MKTIEYDKIVNDALSKGAILHTHEPFEKDYLTLHCLLKKYAVNSVFEIGTHTGEGTNIICNAVPSAKVYSIDLQESQADKSLQHPKYKEEEVGHRCEHPYIQLWGDSMIFNYNKYPCEAYFIDGEHDYAHPAHESKKAKQLNPKIIIWHDADIIEVYNAITDTFAYQNEYELYRVTETAIAYAIRIEK